MNPRKQLRRETAQRIVLKRSQRTDQEQLERLDAKLGVNQGAEKERARLLNRLAEKLAKEFAAAERKAKGKRK